MLTSTLFLALSNGQQVNAQEVADRYLRQLQNAQAVSGTFKLSVSGAAAGSSEAKFVINREGHFRVSTSSTEELFDGRYKYVRDLNKQTYKVFDTRAIGFPLLTAFEPLVQSPLIQNRTELFTGTGSPVASSFEGANSVQMAFGNQRRYINPATALPAGYTESANGIDYKAVFTMVNLEPRPSASAFEFTIKPGERQVPVVTSGLMKVGSVLPSGSESPLGGRFSNSILTVLVFTRASGAASNDAMIGLCNLARQSQPKLNVLAINSETQPAAQYFRGRRTPIPTIQDTTNLTQSAGATQFPTLVVVDREGRVLHAEAAGMEGTIKSFLQSNGYTL
jgi:outer membrane lipoprotein-sorting protein